MKELQQLNLYLKKYSGKLVLGLIITIIATVFKLVVPKKIGDIINIIENYINGSSTDLSIVKKELLNDKIKSIDAVEGFVHNKFRESRNKEGKLTFLDKKSEEEILFKLPLEEV